MQCQVQDYKVQNQSNLAIPATVQHKTMSMRCMTVNVQRHHAVQKQCKQKIEPTIQSIELNIFINCSSFKKTVKISKV